MLLSERQPPAIPLGVQALLGSAAFQPEDASQSGDEVVFQRTLRFDRKPDVLVVAADTQMPVSFYDALPLFALASDQEKAAVAAARASIAFEGAHILLRDCQYDAAQHRLLLHAYKAPYSVIKAVTSGSLLRDVFYFRTGVLMPLVTCDQKIVFLERNHVDPLRRFFSAPAGFMEPFDDRDGQGPSLVFKEGDRVADLAVGTAIKELREEIFGLSAPFESIEWMPCFGLSVRYHHPGRAATIECVMPVAVPQTAEALIADLNVNQSPDADEHNKCYWVFDGSTVDRAKASLQAGGEQSGFFLYAPMIETVFPGLSSLVRTR